MASFKIIGGTPLRGTIAASGSKNAVLPMMAASILADGPVRLENVPRLTDVDTLALVLTELGLSVARPPDDALLLETVDPTPTAPATNWSAGCGPASASWGRCWPGAARRSSRCPVDAISAIGPVDLHLAGLAALGADLRLEGGYVVAEADRLRGADDRPRRTPRQHRHRHGQRAQRRRARPGNHHHPRRGARARDRRPGPLPSLDGRPTSRDSARRRFASTASIGSAGPPIGRSPIGSRPPRC